MFSHCASTSQQGHCCSTLGPTGPRQWDPAACPTETDSSTQQGPPVWKPASEVVHTRTLQRRPSWHCAGISALPKGYIFGLQANTDLKREVQSLCHSGDSWRGRSHHRRTHSYSKPMSQRADPREWRWTCPRTQYDPQQLDYSLLSVVIHLEPRVDEENNGQT